MAACRILGYDTRHEGVLISRVRQATFVERVVSDALLAIPQGRKFAPDKTPKKAKGEQAVRFQGVYPTRYPEGLMPSASQAATQGSRATAFARRVQRMHVCWLRTSRELKRLVHGSRSTTDARDRAKADPRAFVSLSAWWLRLSLRASPSQCFKEWDGRRARQDNERPNWSSTSREGNRASQKWHQERQSARELRAMGLHPPKGAAH